MYQQKCIMTVYNKFPKALSGEHHRIHASVALMLHEWTSSRAEKRPADFSKITVQVINKACANLLWHPIIFFFFSLFNSLYYYCSHLTDDFTFAICSCLPITHSDSVLIRCCDSVLVLLFRWLVMTPVLYVDSGWVIYLLFLWPIVLVTLLSLWCSLWSWLYCSQIL